MSDEAALLQAIRAHPDEDAPRLVYADWLDEQGGAANAARAEYIRLEIAYEHEFSGQRWSKARRDAGKRARELFANHYREWFPELYGRRSILRGARCYPDTERGFPYKLQGNGGKIIAVGERLLQLAPITELQLLDVTTAGLIQFTAAPWARLLRKVGLSGGWGSAEPNYGVMTDGAPFGELRDLAMGFGWLYRFGAERIAKENPFPRLERFYFGCYSDDDAPAALFAGKAFKGLRELDLSGGGRSLSSSPMPGLAEICAAPALAGLKVFDMGWRPTRGLTAVLTGATFWRGLEELDLLRNNLGDKDLALFLDTPSKLKRLDLMDNKITAKGAKALAEHPALKRITHLDLTGNKLGDAGFSALVRSPYARNLQRLEVSTCGFGPAGVLALAEATHLTNLRELMMHSNPIDLKAARALAAAPHLANLDYLYIGSGLTATAKKALRERFGDRVSL